MTLRDGFWACILLLDAAALVMLLIFASVSHLLDALFDLCAVGCLCCFVIHVYDLLHFNVVPSTLPMWLLFSSGQTCLVRDSGDNPDTVHSSSGRLSDIAVLRPG